MAHVAANQDVPAGATRTGRCSSAGGRAATWPPPGQVVGHVASKRGWLPQTALSLPAILDLATWPASQGPPSGPVLSGPGEYPQPFAGEQFLRIADPVGRGGRIPKGDRG